MKRRLIALSVAFILLAAAFMLVSGCKKKKGLSIGTGDTDLFSLVPEKASLVGVVNAKKLAGMEVFDKMIKESEKDSSNKVLTDYHQFILKTGIDPKKDIYAVVVAMMGQITSGLKDPDFIILANVKYDPKKISELMKKELKGYQEEEYNGATLIRYKDDSDDMSICLLTDQVMTIGKPRAIKQVIDLYKGKQGKSILANDKMMSYLKKFNFESILTFAMDFPAEAKKVQDAGMFKVDLTKAEAILCEIDYNDKTWKGYLELISLNGTGNKQLVDTLNSFKGMAAMAGPEVGELVNKMNLTASAGSIKLEASIPEELLNKVSEKMKEKQQSMMPQEPTPEEGTPEDTSKSKY